MINTLILKLSRDCKSNEGFTLVELLVVIIIVGILSAIALPSFLNQAAKAREAEAKTTISSVNSAQNAFRTESSTFAPDMQSLALGLPIDTSNYKFEVVGKADTATITATAKDSAVRGYAGGTVRYGSDKQSALASIVCSAKVSSIDTPTLPTLDTTKTTPETAAKCDATTQDKL